MESDDATYDDTPSQLRHNASTTPSVHPHGCYNITNYQYINSMTDDRY